MRVSIAAPLFAAVLAGCAANGGVSPSGSPSTIPSASNTFGIGGPIAACTVGTWVTTSASASVSTPGASGSITGGGGVIVKVGPNGITEVDFSAMQTAKFVATAAGTKAEGSFVYFGTVSGQVRTGDATSLEGVWEPVGKIDYGDVKLTADLTAPVAARIFDKVPLSSYLGPGAAQTAGVIDVDPLFGKGRYKCGSSTLTLSRPEGAGLTWQLTRK